MSGKADHSKVTRNGPHKPAQAAAQAPHKHFLMPMPFWISVVRRS